MDSLTGIRTSIAFVVLCDQRETRRITTHCSLVMLAFMAEMEVEIAALAAEIAAEAAASAIDVAADRVTIGSGGLLSRCMLTIAGRGEESVTSTEVQAHAHAVTRAGHRA